MAVLSVGHAAVDFAAGALVGLLPFLKDRFDLSYTLVAVLLLASAFSSSIVQPLFGLWSDRRGALWLLPGGVGVAALAIALAADAHAYWLVVVLVTVSGLGVAAYHPEASKFAAYASGRRRATGMSLFSVGGNVGYGLAPMTAGALAASLGLAGIWVLAAPCLVVAAALLFARRFLAGFAPTRQAARAAAGENRPRALSLLLVVVAFRSVAWFGLIAFVPFWEVAHGASKEHGNRLLSLMLLVGGIGTLLQGHLADRLGRRLVMVASLLLVPPLTLVYMHAGGAAGATALAVIGVCVIGTFGVTMVMSQEYLPGNIGIASGLSVGLSIGLGGVGAVALGAIADSVDLEAAFYACVAAAAAAGLLGLLLPPTRVRRDSDPLASGVPADQGGAKWAQTA
jgi:FSR family fosmidomycin resistance protein-like MFS transporter